MFGTRTNMDMNPQTECKFFTLPPELRNECYSLVLDVQTNEAGRVRLLKLFKPSTTVSSLAILQTCRLIRSEALRMFYSNYHFEMDYGLETLSRLKSFVRCSTADRLKAIQTLTIIIPEWENMRGCLTSLRFLTGLSSLTLVRTYRHSQVLHYRLKELDREAPIWKARAKFLPESIVTVKIEQIGVHNGPWDLSHHYPELTTRIESYNHWMEEFIAKRRRKALERASGDVGAVAEDEQPHAIQDT